MPTIDGPVQALERPVRPRLVLLALVFVVLSYGLMQTMLVPTIAVLQRELATDVAGASWAVLTAMLLASVLLTPLAGVLGDRYGKRRVLLVSLAVYLVGTTGAGLAPTIGVLIGFRAVQGIGLALLPLTFALIRDVLPAERVPFGLSLTAGLVGGTAGAGLLVGGLLADRLCWRWIFVFGAVLVAAGYLLTLAFVPPDRRPGHPVRVRRGAGRSGFAPGLLANRALVIVHLCALLLGVHQFVAYSLLPRLAVLPPAEHGFGTTVTGAALILLPGTLVVLPASWATGPLERWLGVRAPLPLGLAVAAVGSGLLAAWHGRVWQAVAWYAVCSVGYGLVMAALPRLVNLVTPASHSGGANGANTVARVLGGALGSQLAAAVAVTGVSGFPPAFLLATASAALGTAFALVRTTHGL